MNSQVKFVKVILVICLILCSAIVMTACDKSDLSGQGVSSNQKLSIVGPTEIIVGEFDVADYKLVLEKDDVIIENVEMTLDMLSAVDFVNMSTVGTHFIKVNYKGLNAQLEIKVLPAKTADDKNEGNLIFEETSSGSLMLSGLKDKSISEVEIPNIYEGKIVDTIADKAFENCANLISVIIPESIANIGAFAFSNCQSLAIYCEISIKPEGWNINWNSFECPIIWDCNHNNVADDGYEYIVYNGLRYAIKDNIAKITRQSKNISGKIVLNDNIIHNDKSIPVTAIGESAFSGCDDVTDIVLSSQILNIEEKAFIDCYSLKSISFNEGLESIAAFAFDGCKFLNNIQLPKSLLSIGKYAFNDCYSLGSLIIPINVQNLGDYVFNNCKDIIICCEASQQPDLWSNTVNEYSGLYWGCKEFVDSDINYEYVITLTDELILTKYKGSDSSIEVPKYIDNKIIVGIGDIFQGNEKVVSLVLNDGIKSIEDKAFSECINLNSVKIPVSVENIGKAVFAGCYSLQNIEVPFIGNRAGVCLTDLYQYPLGYFFGVDEFANSIKVEQRYYGSSTETLTADYFYIPLSLKNVCVLNGVIPCGAFYNCEKLETITLCEGVSIIGNESFRNCYNITSLILPDGISSIGNNAFSNCKNLNNITVPDSVKEIGGSAFSSCLDIEKVNISSIDNWCQINFNGQFANPLYNGAALYMNDALVTELDIDNISFIGANSFCRYSYLEKLTVGETIKTIGDNAFTGCVGLDELVLKEGLESIGESAFSGCDKLISLALPDSVSNLSRFAFAYCDNLNYISIGAGIKRLDEVGIFEASNITSIKIPEGVESLGAQTFYNCKNLTSIILPVSMQLIDYSATRDCNNLREVYYEGTESQWRNVIVQNYNSLNGSMCYYYSESEPDLNENATAYNGRYWHYVSGVATKWEI